MSGVCRLNMGISHGGQPPPSRGGVGWKIGLVHTFIQMHEVLVVGDDCRRGWIAHEFAEVAAHARNMPRMQAVGKPLVFPCNPPPPSNTGNDLVIAIPYEAGIPRRFYRLVRDGPPAAAPAPAGFEQIPAGSFLMGDPAIPFREPPVHRVFVSASSEAAE